MRSNRNPEISRRVRLYAEMARRGERLDFDAPGRTDDDGYRQCRGCGAVIDVTTLAERRAIKCDIVEGGWVCDECIG